MRASLAVLFAGLLLVGSELTQDGDKKPGDKEKPKEQKEREDTFALTESAVFEEVNKIRTKDGLPALKRNPALDKVAQAHVDNIAAKNKYGDDNDGHRMDGKRGDDRLRDAGYAFARWGENVVAVRTGLFAAAPKKTAKIISATVAASWEKSKGHRQSIVDPDFTETGIGVARISVQASDGGAEPALVCCQIYTKPK